MPEEQAHGSHWSLDVVKEGLVARAEVVEPGIAVGRGDETVLGAASVAREADVALTIIDSSHLQGLLERIAGLGLTLCSVNRLETERATPDTKPLTTNCSLRANPTAPPPRS